MNIQVIRQKRRTISLKIESDGQVTLKAPGYVCDNVLNSFVESKRNWLEKNICKINEMNDFKNRFDFYNKIYVLGQVLDLDQVNLTLKDSFPKSSTFSIYYEGYYKQKAAYLLERTHSIAEKLNLKYTTVKLTSSKHFWGNYRKNGDMKLNYKAIILPTDLIDYIIIHELCHGIYLNHSKEFWKAVNHYCPDYKHLKQKLHAYAFLLY